MKLLQEYAYYLKIKLFGVILFFYFVLQYISKLFGGSVIF